MDGPTEAAELAAQETVVVEAPPAITASSALVADAEAVRRRPLTRPGDLAEMMPGLFAVQHAGGGKANQYFVRGFDADHGTDVALSIDGVPVNLVSHAHGQGYADLHPLIPELVQRVVVRKGPYELADHDFATAGAIDFELVDRLQENLASLTVGSFGTLRGLAMVGVGDHAAGGWLAAEAYGSDGPFLTPENLSRVNLVARGSVRRDRVRASLSASRYSADWTASGQLPLREVEAGELSRWGTMDPTDGGVSSRNQLWGTVGVEGETSTLRASAWLGNYSLGLWSNFTFRADHPDQGDQILQTDARVFSGLDAAWSTRAQWGPVRVGATVGTQARHDRADTQLMLTEARTPWQAQVDAGIVENRAGGYVRVDAQWGRIRWVGGARLDRLDFQVADALALSGTGARGATRVSPRMSLVGAATPWWEVFLDAGRGFHSNDARGVVRMDEPADPMTTALGYEVGTRFHGRRGQLALTAWGLDLDAETVWVGDAGTTELRGATARRGVEASFRAAPWSWLNLDFDGTLSDAVYVENAGNGDAVALAPRITMSGGGSVVHPSGWTAGARVRHLGARPATEDGSLVAEGFTVVDAEANWRWRALRIGAQVNNVGDVAWREVQFANASRLADEPAAVEDIHFTPGWPRTVLFTVGMGR